MNEYLSLFGAGFLLCLAQFVAALPWLWALDPQTFRRMAGSASGWGYSLISLAGTAVLAGAALNYIGDPDRLRFYGRIFASILHLQLAVDLFILLPQLLLLVWPRGGAVALSAFREGWRQPMFWLIAALAAVLITFSMVIPYFTFGDDYKMMKQLGFDTVMLSAALFGVLAASISINEEIEGRTAVTLISKPVTRRQFLIGKFLGITLAAAAMTALLGWWLNWALYIKPYFDKLDEVKDVMPLQGADNLQPLLQALLPGAEGDAFAEGIGYWFGEALAHSFGLLLGFGQVMVLVAIAAALATRLPFVANLVICLTIFFLGHLSPVLVQVTQNLAATSDSSPILLVGFLAQLFDAVLPALEFFNMGPAIIRDLPIDLWEFAGYVLRVFGYALLYCAIALLGGLILFEDRDLA